MKMPKACFAIITAVMIAVLLPLGASAGAENPAPADSNAVRANSDVGSQAQTAESGARFMLGGARVEDGSTGETELTAADFSWNAITHNGPASGANPVVGKRGVTPFFDFKDGQPFPYYVK